MNNNTSSILIVLLVIGSMLTIPTQGQTCGFGCLGLSGFYGGYTYQNYKTDELNKHLNILLEEFNYSGKKIDFSQGNGFRIGANIFRANFDTYFITAKGYYQFLSEDQALSEKGYDGAALFKSTLQLNHWAIGLDLGIPISRFFNWKVLEGGLTFYTAELNNNFNFEGQLVESRKYQHSDVNLGYFIGTGLILNIIPDYVSIEGGAFYNNVSIDNLIDDDGNYFYGEYSKSKILEAGGFSTSLQLNIGVPL